MCVLVLLAEVKNVDENLGNHGVPEVPVLYPIYTSHQYFRLESYSCKMVGQEKALYKRFHSFSGVSDMQALSPPQSMLEASSPHSHAKYVCFASTAVT